MADRIDYYLALSSPWTYLAGPRFKALARRNKLDVTFRPYNIMHVFGINGTKPVAQRPKPIQANRLRELGRWHAFLGMPLNLKPKFFPVDPTLAGKMLIAAQRTGAAGDKVIDLSFAFLSACWAEERNLADDDTLVAIANDAGFDGGALLKSAKAGAADAEFDRNTEDALANDVFGSPTWMFMGELFWGQDRLEFLTRTVEGGS
ncbi:MAG TPA: 2-hydroxychromene-2-carboxylate isomerase [Alphaproteobacteria bacterium]